jgi:hypothetical protein
VVSHAAALSAVMGGIGRLAASGDIQQEAAAAASALAQLAAVKGASRWPGLAPSCSAQCPAPSSVQSPAGTRGSRRPRRLTRPASAAS